MPNFTDKAIAAEKKKKADAAAKKKVADQVAKTVAYTKVAGATKQAQQKQAFLEATRTGLGGGTVGGAVEVGGADPYGNAALTVESANLQNASEEEVIAWIEENYAPEVTALLGIPELRNIILTSAREEYSPQLVVTKLHATDWWKSRSESQRTFDALELTDPTAFNAKVDERMAELIPEWESYGVDGDIRAAAISSLKLGWNDDQIRILMAQKLQEESSKEGLEPFTTGAADADELMRIARQEYLTPIDRQTAERWAIKAIRQGADIEQEWRSYLSSITAGRFGLDPTSGVTPADMMAPVRSVIADALEMSPDSIDLLAPQYSDVMMQQEGGTYRPMSQFEALKWARKQPQYAATKGATEEASALADGISRAFGGHA